MPAPVNLRRDYSAGELQRLAADADSPALARRLRAMAAIAQGQSRAKAARIGGMARQTLRDWVRRFNALGPEGLANRKSPGRPCKLSKPQRRELAALLTATADGHAHCEPTWRVAQVSALIKQEFDIEIDAVGVARLLRNLGLRYDRSGWRIPSPNARSAQRFTAGSERRPLHARGTAAAAPAPPPAQATPRRTSSA